MYCPGVGGLGGQVEGSFSVLSRAHSNWFGRRARRKQGEEGEGEEK